MTEPASSAREVRCDLVLLTWNRKDLLEPCVERMLAYTKLPSRLLIVDNGSTDLDALAFLDQITGTEWVTVEVIKRQHNDGFAKGMNAGLRLASAPWICVLNNDILVTDQWLEEMIRVAEASPAIGLVNPMSNEFDLSPAPGESLDHVAQRCQRLRGRWIESWGCVAFCMLLSRRVLQQVGDLDETFEFIYYEDADYSLRVRQAGFITAIAEGAYVYHHGSATMKRDPLHAQRFHQNAERFYRKWKKSQPLRIACVVTDHQRLSVQTTASWIRHLANEGHKIWVFSVSAERAAVPRHLQVVPIVLRPPFAFPQLLWRVLTKKKRFDRIVVSGGRAQRLLEWLRPLHRAVVERIPQQFCAS